MIISISGLPGSGKSTVAKIIAEKLGFERIYMGGILRNIADQRGLTILELLKEAETNSSIDEDADKMVTDLGRTKDNFIIESRTAFYFIPDSFKVFIKVSAEEGAKRIYGDLKKEERKNEEKAETLDGLKQKLKERIETDSLRYEKYYGIDFLDESNYDLVVDSTYLPATEVAEKVLVEFEKQRAEASKTPKEKEF